MVEVITGPDSSNNNDKFSLPTVNKDYSDFGQMFQGSKEFPKKINVLDHSITFTDDANKQNQLRTLDNN